VTGPWAAPQPIKAVAIDTIVSDCRTAALLGQDIIGFELHSMGC
jgi:hypothetical protein